MSGIEYHSVPRKPCVNCVRKHLGQAIVLLQESLHGYPDHRWIAIGHIAEAEAEVDGVWPDMAKEFRKVRKNMERNEDWVPDLLPAIRDISKRMKKGSEEETCVQCPVATTVEGPSLPTTPIPRGRKNFRAPIEDLEKKYTKPQLDTNKTVLDVAQGRRGSRTSVARDLRRP